MSAFLEISADSRGGCFLLLRVKPGAKSNRLSGFHNGALRVEVTSAPEKGKANKAVIKVLAKELKLAPKNISVISGQTSQNKKIQFDHLLPDDLRQKISKIPQLA